MLDTLDPDPLRTGRRVVFSAGCRFQDQGGGITTGASATNLLGMSVGDLRVAGVCRLREHWATSTRHV